jgi:hypothetical protein
MICEQTKLQIFGKIWNESIGTPLKCVEWWESVPDETVDLFVHSSLGDVLLVVLSLVEAVASVHVFVVAGSLERRWVRSVGNEWESASHSGVEWWQVTSNESMDLLIHTSLCNIFIVVLVMVMFLVLSKRIPSKDSILSPWLRFSFLTIDSRDNAACKIVNFRIITALIHILELGLLLMLNKRLGFSASIASPINEIEHSSNAPALNGGEAAEAPESLVQHKKKTKLKDMNERGYDSEVYDFASGIVSAING